MTLVSQIPILMFYSFQQQKQFQDIQSSKISMNKPSKNEYI